jgi:hypothetical protein
VFVNFCLMKRPANIGSSISSTTAMAISGPNKTRYDARAAQ